MENQRQKWVNLSFLAGVGLLVYVLFLLLNQLVGIYDLEARFQQIDLLVRAVCIGVGLITFFVLYRSDKSNQFMHEVIVELGRVTWPTTLETRKGTIVVIIMVLIASFILGGLDTFWAWILNLVI